MSIVYEKIELIIEDLEKALKLPKVKGPVLPSPKAPVVPPMPSAAPPVAAAAAAAVAQPTVVQASKKNPIDQAQQIKDPSIKDNAMKIAKQKIKLSKNGQWSLYDQSRLKKMEKLELSKNGQWSLEKDDTPKPRSTTSVLKEYAIKKNPSAADDADRKYVSKDNTFSHKGKTYEKLHNQPDGHKYRVLLPGDDYDYVEHPDHIKELDKVTRGH